uniref:Uncharacterized protein n=1 Tax=Leersia perrieri TaxID=77586 RepID=A0A0D9WQD1_9ORYZ
MLPSLPSPSAATIQSRPAAAGHAQGRLLWCRICTSSIHASGSRWRDAIGRMRTTAEEDLHEIVQVMVKYRCKDGTGRWPMAVQDEIGFVLFS